MLALVLSSGVAILVVLALSAIVCLLFWFLFLRPFDRWAKAKIDRWIAKRSGLTSEQAERFRARN